MRIYIMTDMEGVSGVLNFRDWCQPTNRYYETGKDLLTHEVNAAISGFFDGGVAEIVVVDGHGAEGIDIRLLDSRVEMLTDWPEGYPFLLDDSYDCIAWVGQHAKAGTEYAHLPHTGEFHILDLSVNGRSLGEFGQLAMCASSLGVRSIFGSGDLAFTKEARELIPGIEVVSVKRGVRSGTGNECSTEDYSRRNEAAIHIPPARARTMICDGARKAAQRALNEDFGLIPVTPPFERVVRSRATSIEPAREIKTSHPTNFIELLGMP